MPNYSGRSFLIKKGSAVIASVRTKTATFNGEPIDATTDDDDSFRRLLADPATRSMDLSVEGLTDDASLRNIIGDPAASLELTDINLEYPDGATVTGTFFLTSVEESGQHTDAMGFSASLQSSGQWVYTPAP